MDIRISDKNNVLGQASKRSGIPLETLKQIIVNQQKKKGRSEHETYTAAD
jgi:hypothetical protein